MIILRFGFYFCLSYFILSFEFSGRTVFDQIDERISPIKESSVIFLKKRARLGWETLKEVGQSLINVKSPSAQDQIRSALSSPERNVRIPNVHKRKLDEFPPKDDFTAEEKLLLQKVIRDGIDTEK